MRGAAIVILMLALPAAAADFSGIWAGQISLRGGVEQDIAFQFTQKGEALSGKLYGDYGSTRITEGKVSGEKVWFVIETAEQAGNQINTSRLRFEGCLLDGTLELTRTRESSTNAGNAGGVQSRPESGQRLGLRRLL